MKLNEVLNSGNSYGSPRGALKSGGGQPDFGMLSGPKADGQRISETEVVGTGEFVTKVAPVDAGKTVTGEDGVTLNLVEVPIAEAAKTVLGDILKLNYNIAAEVTGNITLQSTTPVAPSDLLAAFEAVLKSRGAVLIASGGMYNIVPSGSASQTGIPLARSARPAGAGLQAQIIPLRHISASEMRRIIEPIVHQGGVLRADDTRNILVVSGNARELSDTSRIIQTFDVDWMKGMSVGLYPLESSDPEAVAGELKTVFGLDKPGPLTGVVRVLPNRRLGSVLVISSKPQHLDTARSWIERLDKAAQQSERQLFVYRIQNRPATELATLLRNVLTSDDEKGPHADGPVAPRYETEQATSTGSLLSTGAAEIGSKTDSSMNATGAMPAATAETTSAVSDSKPNTTESFQAGRVKIVADAGNNALLIEALPKEYERISRILARLDMQPIQVMLEAVIAEVSLNDELRFGVKWYFQNNPNKFTFTDALTGAVAPQFPGFSYFFAIKDVKVAVDALSGITDVKVVSAPSLMVMDNRKATLQIGDQVPIVTQTAQSVTDPNAPIVNAVTMKDTGVILAVTPRVNESGRVVLDIEQEVSNVKKTTTSGIDSPTIQQRRVQTTVSVLDGEVVALGGLIQQRDSLTKTQVPILGNLPVVGTVFREKETSVDRTELVIFIRPLVVRDDDEARQVTEEFQSRINIDEMSRTRGDRHYGRDAKRILR